MRRFHIILSTLLLAAIMLTACGADQDDNHKGTATPFASAVPSATAPVTESSGSAGTGTGTPAAGVPVTGGEDNPARLSNEMHFTVWDKNGDQIGDVNDMVLDLDNNRISYVIVGAGGFLGLGERDVLVPWDQVKFQSGNGDNTGGYKNVFILQGDAERYKNAPDINVHTLIPRPGQPAGDWDDVIRNYWKNGTLPPTPATNATVVPGTDTTATPATTATVTGEIPPAALQGVILASDALGADVRIPGKDNGQDDDIKAEIDDIIVDVNTGDVKYIVLDTKFDDGEHWIPVPLKAFLWDSQNEAFVLSNMDAATLQTAPSLHDGQYPDLTVGGWDKDFVQFWQNIANGGGVQATPTP